MAEVKNSKTLENVLIMAKTKAEKSETETLTQRFFVLALIEYIKAMNDTVEGPAVKQVFGKYWLDFDKIHDEVIACLGKDAGFGESLFFSKKLYDAKALVAKKGGTELTCDFLLECILSEPEDSLKEVIQKTKDEGLEGVKRILEELEIDIDDEEPQKTSTSLSGMVSVSKKIRAGLKAEIFGQDNAVNTFVTGYFQSELMAATDKTKRRPKASFLFAGPPGVGKTFTAETAAKILGLPFQIFDMSEYSDKEASIEFAGSDKVYKNGKAGNVTSFVSANPKCVILFDEIEKAHISVIHLFLQILDAGRIRDNFTDEEVSFKDVIIIMTTNAGKQLYEDSESLDLSGISRKIVINALKTDKNPNTGVPYFPAAICSRFASGNVVMFNHIGAHNLRSIAKKEIEKHIGNFEKEMGIKTYVDDKVYTALLFAEGGNADARTIRARSETFFNDEIYELLRLISSEKNSSEVSDVEKITIDVDLSNATEEIAAMFECDSEDKILVFAGSDTVEACAQKIDCAEVIGVNSVQEATEILKKEDISIVLIDLTEGLEKKCEECLNIEDIESSARDFLKVLHEKWSGIPVFLLENDSYSFGEEEAISFMRQGIRGFLKQDDSFAEEIKKNAMVLHQQACIVRLAGECKTVSFETAQSVIEAGKVAQIKLFDFKKATDIDSEDSKSVLSGVSRPDIKFEDVLGATEAKKELTYFAEYLKNPKKYMDTGVKAPKGVIMYGEPGTGKTMLAKAIASEADVAFIATEGNQFLKGVIGEGSEAVHKIFRIARKYAPSILFIDEIDAIAKERKGTGSSEDTLTAFLTEMDGFVSDPTRPVFVLAATNFDVEPGREKSLDPALMRRFDRRIYIDLPDRKDRIKFIRMKMEKNPALQISDAKIENIAMRATGLSLAVLDSIVELALRSAIRAGSTVVNDEIFEEAFETFNGGEVKKWDSSQLERVARHESGHALLCYLSGETPSYLTVVARGNHGGYMQHSEQEGKAIYTKDEILSKIRISLGGRAAEVVYYGEKDGVSTGASGDLFSATNMAQRIICEYGMDESFGLAVTNPHEGEIAVKVRDAVNKILNEQMNEAIRLVSENKNKIDALVDSLMDNNHLTGPEIEKILKS